MFFSRYDTFTKHYVANLCILTLYNTHTHSLTHSHTHIHTHTHTHTQEYVGGGQNLGSARDDESLFLSGGEVSKAGRIRLRDIGRYTDIRVRIRIKVTFLLFLG